MALLTDNGVLLTDNGVLLTDGGVQQNSGPDVDSFAGFEQFNLYMFKIESQIFRLSKLKAEFGESYRRTATIGAEDGNRNWSIQANLSDLQAFDDVSRRAGKTRWEYFFDFYYRHVISGTPFVIRDPQDGFYYLAEFAESNLSREYLSAKLMSVAGVPLTQRRLRDKAVLSVRDNLAGWWRASAVTPETGNRVAAWTDISGNGRDLLVVGDSAAAPVLLAGERKGKAVVNFNGTYQPLRLDETLLFRHFFVAVSITPAVFADFAGLLSSDSTELILVGNPDAARFFNDLYTDVEYRQNGVIYPNTNRLAPMNGTWAIVEIKRTAGWLAQLKVGKDRNFSGRLLNAKIGEIVAYTETRSEAEAAMIRRYLKTEWV